MITRGCENKEISTKIGCNVRSVQRARAKFRRRGTTKPPLDGVGRRKKITPTILRALIEHLTQEPELYQDEMADFLYDKFHIVVATSTISRALASARWSRKVTRRVAHERNADLRDFYLSNLSGFRSYHLIYIDESGCNNHDGSRRTGWSPLGTAPVQVNRFHRERRYHILPAYSQDGVITSWVYQGSTDSTVLESFIERLLPYCGRWPEPKSVLVMDNASFHHSPKIKQLCDDAGVKLVFLPPYSPDLNPIEEFFAQLKKFIKRHWRYYAKNSQQKFGPFLEWCVSTVGACKESARGHFRNAGVFIEEFEQSIALQ